MASDRQLAERLLLAADLWATGIAMRRQALRRQHPHASDVDVEALLMQWLQDRPGAAYGDGPQPDAP